MAPLDRREHRQQRVRGAGPSAVQASFGFKFGALGAPPAKQAPLPAQRRRRSASIQRRSGTPKNQAAPPHLGKRKRGSALADPGEDDGEQDELSPDREELVRAIERSRRVVGTASPIREQVDEAADELSVLEHGASTARTALVHASVAMNGTPASQLAQKSTSAGSLPAPGTPADSIGSTRPASRKSTSRRSRSRSTNAVPATPAMHLNARLPPSLPSRPSLDTPTAAQADDESEDELSPSQVNGATPRVVATEQQSAIAQREDDHMEIDELSSPVQQTPAQATPVAQKANRVNDATARQIAKQPAAEPPAKRGRPRRVVLDDQDDVASAPVAKSATPIARKPKSKKAVVAEDELDEDDQLDHLSPDKHQASAVPKQSTKRSKEVVTLSDREGSEQYEEPEQEEEPETVPRPPPKRPLSKHAHHVKPSSDKPPRKRHRFLGPKQAISVMRIKGSTVRGITVADTTRTILEETINHRLQRMAEKMQTSQDSARRKELRGELNMSLSFKESLNEKLLDLQDANDVLSSNFNKMKLFKRDNAELRKDILTLQNNRQGVALEHDDVQAEYETEKARVDARNKLSADMFSIEAAIQNGRKKARREGREDEGPQVPISMLIGMVGRDVGSSGGGLLSNIKVFNGALERAAGWLEGRA
ncbi:hypothetical protein BDU57DRAFT_589360 [Ampelomyces quisqualis]|uniref:Inner kinetochore subunit AME1 domain-containing protein n=1 Tax=Ampelomyces quisqualis TaxID=50730 RepID=A0A6A5QI79_AMPQU|nr:hypothetical protein BDU57DRAFT_589360 [Ampelomyces quisqualis]